MRRKLSMIMMLCLAIVVLVAGCGGGGTSTGNTPSPAPGEQNGQEGQEPPTKFTISMRDLNIPYVVNHPNINQDKWKLELEKLTNTEFEIQLIPQGSWVESMTVMFVSGNIPDVVMAGSSLFGSELAGAVENGVFMPLNDLLEEHGQNLLRAIPQEAWDFVTHEGNIYAIPDFLTSPSRRATVIRMDLLEKTGLDVPRTTDEFLEVLRAFKELGVEHPYAGREDFKYADTFFGAFDAFPYQWEYYEGQVVPKFMAGDKGKQAVAFYKQLYDEGLIHKEFITMTASQYSNAILSGNAGMWSRNGNSLLVDEQSIQENVPDARLEIISSPIGPDGKGGHLMNDPTIHAYYINANTKVDMAKLIQFFDWQVTEEGQNFFLFGGDPDIYVLPTTAEELNEDDYRANWLGMVKEKDFNNRGYLERLDADNKMLRAFDEVLVHEGRDSIKFLTPLESLSNPDISAGGDVPSTLWMNGVARLIVGNQPIDYYDEIVEDWLRRGGQAAIEEATQRYLDQVEVYIPSE